MSKSFEEEWAEVKRELAQSPPASPHDKAKLAFAKQDFFAALDRIAAERNTLERASGAVVRGFRAVFTAAGELLQTGPGVHLVSSILAGETGGVRGSELRARFGASLSQQITGTGEPATSYDLRLWSHKQGATVEYEIEVTDLGNNAFVRPLAYAVRTAEGTPIRPQHTCALDIERASFQLQAVGTYLIDLSWPGAGGNREEATITLHITSTPELGEANP